MEGQFQDKIEELPELELYRYENIFKVYKTGGNDFYYYNILKKITWIIMILSIITKNITWNKKI